MTKQEEILLAPLPKGYKWIVDYLTGDNTAIAVILPDGSIEYRRVVVDAN